MLNVISLMGRLVADPQLRHTTNNNISTTTFTIACERSFVPQGKERETDFLDIVCWRGTAEFACKYFRKGQLIAVNGSLQTRSYEDKNGIKRKAYEILADNLHFAGSKPAQEDERADAPDAVPAKQVQGDESGLNAGPNGFEVISNNEDLPF